MINQTLSAAAFYSVVLASAALLCQSIVHASSSPLLPVSPVNIPMASNQAAPVAQPETILSARFPLVGLSLVAKHDLKQVTENEGQIEFGQVSALDASQLEQVFQLKNTGKAPLTIERLQTSCHCTRAVFETAGQKGNRLDNEGDSLDLQPGQTATVHVRINLDQLAPGLVVKSVFVFLKGNTQPAAIVTLTGELRPNLSLWPRQMDFGQVTLGSPRSLTVTATFDPRLAPGSTLPALISSDPDIQVVPLPTQASDEATPLSGGTGTPPSKTGMLRQTYRITLAATAAGPISAKLSFAPPVPATKTAVADIASKAAPDKAAPSAILANISIPVQGTVGGDIAAEPAALALGPVSRQHTASGQVVLAAQTEDTLAGAVVTSSSPFVSGRLQSMQAPLGGGGMTVEPGSKNLEITIDAKAPLGLLQTTVTVTLANGQRLHVPVSAYIIAPSTP